MIKDQPREILGESLHHWDQFYANHYDWLYQSSLRFIRSESQAKALTQRIFTKLLLSHPEMIVNSNRESLILEIAMLYPDLKEYLGIQNVTVNQLMKTFYSPN